MVGLGLHRRRPPGLTPGAERPVRVRPCHEERHDLREQRGRRQPGRFSFEAKSQERITDALHRGAIAVP